MTACFFKRKCVYSVKSLYCNIQANRMLLWRMIHLRWTGCGLISLLVTEEMGGSVDIEQYEVSDSREA